MMASLSGNLCVGCDSKQKPISRLKIKCEHAQIPVLASTLVFLELGLMELEEVSGQARSQACLFAAPGQTVRRTAEA